MAHFAEISSGVVTNVIVVHNNELLVDGVEIESKGAEFCHNLFGGTWIQTSYNGNFRKQFASSGYVYNVASDVFVKPQPYPSYTLDSNYDWQPPIPMPLDNNHIHKGTGQSYLWDEENIRWVPV